MRHLYLSQLARLKDSCTYEVSRIVTTEALTIDKTYESAYFRNIEKTLKERLMAEAVKRKSTLDKHALKKIGHRLQEGYARQTIYEEMKQEYSDLTRLATQIAATPNLEQVRRYQGLLNLFKALLATLLVFKIGVGVMVMAGNLPLRAATDITALKDIAALKYIARFWPFLFLVLLILQYVHILSQSQKLTNGTKPFWLGLGLIADFPGGLLLLLEIVMSLTPLQIAEVTSIPLSGAYVFVVLNLGSAIAAIVVAVKLKGRLFPHLQQLAESDYSNPGKIFRKNQNIADNPKESSGTG